MKFLASELLKAAGLGSFIERRQTEKDIKRRLEEAVNERKRSQLLGLDTSKADEKIRNLEAEFARLHTSNATHPKEVERQINEMKRIFPNFMSSAESAGEVVSEKPGLLRKMIRNPYGKVLLGLGGIGIGGNLLYKAYKRRQEQQQLENMMPQQF